MEVDSIICLIHRSQMTSVRSNTFEAKKSNSDSVIVTEISNLFFKEVEYVKIIEETPLLSKSDNIANAD